MDLVGLTVKVYDASGRLAQSHEFRGFERNQLFVEQTRRFLACIQTGEQPVVTLRDGIQSLRMALAAKESLEKGTVVSLSKS